MTFEEDFPSFKKCKYPLDIKIIENDFHRNMSNESIQYLFRRLTNQNLVINMSDFKDNFLDKQRVREAIEKYITSKTTCNGFYNLTSLDIKQFEKELGF